ncbi:MAG: T9SS type A sorting domain-containing protein [Bacteroidetes bacterium]|nr:T9SS type A sorting domain-containing protein [Bacteroidota bacterium]
MQHINPVLETSIDQSLVQLTESQVLSGWENLILTNTLVEGNWNQGGQLQASARDNVVLNVESNMQRGSEVHLFTDNTIYPSCSEWSYLLPTHEWRLGKVDNNPANISNINLKFIQLNDCKIYPNPGTGIFTIDFGNRNLKEPITCIIKNIQGSVLSNTLINECVTRIELEQFRSGIYIIELKSRDINLTKKIIKL